MHNFLTSVYPEGDVRSAFLSVTQALHHAKNGIDMVSSTPVSASYPYIMMVEHLCHGKNAYHCLLSNFQIHTHFARPNWSNIFSRLSRKHVGAKIGEKNISCNLGLFSNQNS
jgi:respiratory burst oxidase